MELLPYMAARIKAAVLLGETKVKLQGVAEQAGVGQIVLVEGGKPEAEATIHLAVREAAALAQPGDIVLLSPACASWDMFPSYEVRGRMFKEAVHTI
jgi:UDP-N-acetylmuramoylalanine--D-glutamate ligase